VTLINEKGYNCGMVARAIGASRSAVVSKMHRLMRHGVVIKMWPIGMTGRLRNGWKPKAAQQALKEQCERINRETRKVVTHNGRVRSVTVNSKVGRIVLNQKISHYSAVVPAQVVALRGDQCRWPIGELDQDNFFFCHNAKIEGTSYCYCHLAASFRSVGCD
jgi:hypothetical protein